VFCQSKFSGRSTSARSGIARILAWQSQWEDSVPLVAKESKFS
jgi:hypothetical protein